MRAGAFGGQSAGEFSPHPQEHKQWQDRKERPEEDDLAQWHVLADGLHTDEHACHQEAGQKPQVYAQ